MDDHAVPADTTTITTRLDDLEVKAAFAEDLLDRLNLLVYRQQQQIDDLTGQLGLLRRQVAAGADGDAGVAAGDPRAELPPHY